LGRGTMDRGTVLPVSPKGTGMSSRPACLTGRDIGRLASPKDTDTFHQGTGIALS
jgi:hypothetical protein